MNRRDIFAQNLKKRVMNTLKPKQKTVINFLAISLSLVFSSWQRGGFGTGKEEGRSHPDRGGDAY